jgi:hypothetical protein
MDLMEMTDFQLQFFMYYSEEIPKMKAFRMQKTKEIKAQNGDGLLEEVDENQNTIRANSSSGTYKVCKRNGIGKMLPLFGLNAEEFGENLIANHVLNFTHQCELPLEEVLKNFTTE